MSRATPRPVRSRLPGDFRRTGGPARLMFEEPVIRADTDEMEDLVGFTGGWMKQCLRCRVSG